MIKIRKKGVRIEIPVDGVSIETAWRSRGVPMYANPPKPGWYLCHVCPKALAEHLSTLYWDGEQWCGDNSPNRDVQAVQKRYWARLEGGTIYTSLGQRNRLC